MLITYHLLLASITIFMGKILHGVAKQCTLVLRSLLATRVADRRSRRGCSSYQEVPVLQL